MNPEHFSSAHAEAMRQATDPVESYHKSMAYGAATRRRFCGFDREISYDDPEVVDAAQWLLRLARMDCGASPSAARILIACQTGDTALSIEDFRCLDEKNFRAAMVLLNVALFHGCGDLLPVEANQWLRKTFEFQRIGR